MKKMHAALEKFRVACAMIESARTDFLAAIAETELPLQIEKNVPTTEAAKRIAILYKRRLTTPWSVPEIKAFKLCGSITSEELDLVEKYYAHEIAKGEHGPNAGIHRRDLSTFLNNWRGELDRARAFASKTPKGWAQDTQLKAKKL